MLVIGLLILWVILVVRWLMEVRCLEWISLFFSSWVLVRFFISSIRLLLFGVRGFSMVVLCRFS